LVFAISYKCSERMDLSLGFSVGVGIFKEMFDKGTKKGNPEVLDAIYTAAGGLTGYFIVR